MDQDLWNAVDHYFTRAFRLEDDVLEAALQASDAAGLPQIAVAPNQGRLLEILARLVGARRILEIGVLGGYSTIWLARGLAPGGSIVGIEYEARHAAVATANIARAGFGDRVEIRIGAGLDMLPALHAEGGAPFDLVFIDADKANIPGYFEWALRLSRRGSLIVVDNVVRHGAIVDPANDTPDVIGVRRFAEMVEADPRVSATALQTVGVKGHDGLAIVLVVADP